MTQTSPEPTPIQAQAIQDEQTSELEALVNHYRQRCVSLNAQLRETLARCAELEQEKAERDRADAEAQGEGGDVPSD